METRVTFTSDGLELCGIVHTPEGAKPSGRRPAFLVLHGFGGNKDGEGTIAIARKLAEWGYATLRFDFRGCGESQGVRGWILCLDQVADTSSALSYMASRGDVDPNRIALIGSSFGAAVAVFAGGTDKRAAAVVSCGGWGNGERKFRRQHPTPEAWSRFTRILDEGKSYRRRTGASLMVPRYEIVPIPERLRNRMSRGSIMEFPAETAQSMFDFRADDQVANIAPRPLLLLHSANDSVTPTVESIEMFNRARQPAELHLFSDIDHFAFNEDNSRLLHTLSDWLGRYFPA